MAEICLRMDDVKREAEQTCEGVGMFMSMAISLSLKKLEMAPCGSHDGDK